MMPKIYILLPVHNRHRITEQFIDCLLAQTYSSYHLVLINDGSTDGTEEMARSKIKNLTILKGKGDWWWAGSLQQGIDWLAQQELDDRDIVVFANDDITFEADFLQLAVSHLEKREGLLLPQILDEQTGKPRESGVEVDFRAFSFNPASSSERINCLPTRGLFMRLYDLRKVGGFYPRILPHYWSDYEFTIRAWRRGIRLYTDSAITIRADLSASGHRDFIDTNFLRFLRRYFNKKSVSNPYYSSIFILLACPVRYIPLNLFRIWRNAGSFIVKCRLKSFKIWRDRVRTLKAISVSAGKLKIIIGAAATKQDGWISTNYPILDLTDDKTFTELFASEKVSNFLAEHVWEHLSPEDGAKAANNCFAFLKEGGVLRIAVPDGFHPDADYLAQVRPGGYGPGSDDHKVLYNYQTLSALLEGCGFKTRLLEWFDERGNFHHEEWDSGDGLIIRSMRWDPRNRVNSTAYTSLIIDAKKPE